MDIDSGHPHPITLPQVNVTQTPPISGTQYVLLDTVRRVRINQITLEVTWTIQPSPLELHCVVDGVTIRHAVSNPVSGTVYRPTQAISIDANQTLAATWTAAVNNALQRLSGRSVRLLMETTGGTVSELEGVVHYQEIR